MLSFSLKTVPFKSRDSAILRHGLDNGEEMNKSRYTEEQIAYAIRQGETGTRVEDICRQMGISEAVYYNWKKKYGGLGVGEVRRLKQLEEGNRKLKQIVADLSLDKQMLQDVIKKKF